MRHEAPDRNRPGQRHTPPTDVSRLRPNMEPEVQRWRVERTGQLFRARYTSGTALCNFIFGKVLRKVTLFGYCRDFAFFSTAQAAETLRIKKMCLIGLTGLHSLICL